MTEPRLQIVQSSETFLHASYGRVQISSWRHRIVRSDLETMFASAQKLVDGLAGAKMLNLTVVDTAVKLPDDATRKLSSELMLKMATMQQASATVLEGEGFLAGAARAAFAGMILVSRSPMPQKAFATIDAAAAWLGSMGGLSGDDVTAIAQAAKSVRQQHLTGAAAPGPTTR